MIDHHRCADDSFLRQTVAASMPRLLGDKIA
jgi:hypothetical protein